MFVCVCVYVFVHMYISYALTKFFSLHTHIHVYIDSHLNHDMSSLSFLYTQFISDCVECDSSLAIMEQVLASDEIGRNEQNTLSLLRKLDVRF